MQPLCLTLTGFRGIRDGLGLDTLTLDFEALADGAALVAIVGANGRGKSTVLDNLHPYLLMPSRASIAGAGGFSFYDHVFLPESEKDLAWAQDGRSYRSQVVIRLQGRRRTEAFVFQLSDAGTWVPVRLENGTVSDGKVDTYTRCIEHLCGSADTFFASVFGAQGKRPLSDYRNAEIKSLLGDLLGLDRIRELGHQASESAKLLKAGLLAMRQDSAAMEADATQLACEIRDLAGAPADVAQARAALGQAAAAWEAARCAVAELTVQRARMREGEQRRAQLLAEREAVQAAACTAVQDLDARAHAEHQRALRLDQQITQRVAQTAERRQRLVAERDRCRAVLASASAVRHAVRRCALGQQLLQCRAQRLVVCRKHVNAHVQAQAVLRLQEQRIAALEREAGQAAMREQDLQRRFGLTAEVPCRGTTLQAHCGLLSDARSAQALIPSARHSLERLAQDRAEAQRQAETARSEVARLARAPCQMREAERRLERTRTTASALVLQAAKAPDLATARQRLAQLASEWKELKAQAGAGEAGHHAREQAERQAIAAALRVIEDQRAQLRARDDASLARLDAVLDGLPPPFNAHRMDSADAALQRATQAHGSAQQALLAALQRADALATLQRQQSQLVARRARAERRAHRTERAIGDWTLLAQGLGNDGIVALAIDDAGPSLSALVNALLLACYGPRFSVAILTQAETANGLKREDFDIVVDDMASGERKSVRLMSGGERVWVNECLVRGVALYLAQTGARRHDTLFSDEADGPLDPARKRMFGAMKREVLRLGGYQREFFISQTPEVAGMADAVLDLEALAAGTR